MKTLKILLLDDDASNVKPVNEFFQPFDAEIYFTSNADDALDKLETANSDLSLVSLKLAHAKNWYLLKKMKENLSPIIGLVGHDQSSWMKEGQSYGINAYLVKPLDYLHLKTYFPTALSQVWTCKKTGNSEKERRSSYDRRTLDVGRRWYDRLDRLDQFVNVVNMVGGVVNAGPFTIDKQKKCVYRNGSNLKLTPKEYKLFLLLLQNKEKVVSIDEIISHIWTSNRRASDEDVKQYIYMLRKKIEENPSNPCLILNMKGFGYMFSCGNVSLYKAS